jgi:hypothetical protein
MAKLKPWYQVVTPREDLRENKGLDAAEFAVHLDQIRDGRAPKDYIDPARFFDRTHLTASLLDLASQAVRRLSGIQVETSAVFNMATQFGGGKSHSLTTLYHLAKHGDRAKTWRGVDRILRQAHLQDLPQAEVAVFVGTEYDPLTGRGGDGEPIRKSIWGEIAWQLGREKAFATVSEHDARGVAPGGDVIRMMLPDRPCLILFDELLNYASRGRQLGARDQLVNFLQNLCEEARARTGLVVCVSIPKSVDLEMNPDDVRDYQALKMMLDRVGKAIMMSVDREIAEIIRLRLFDWNGMPDEGRKTAATYAEWTIEHGAELAGFDADTIRERFQSAYPFHPATLSVFERKWAGLPRFQRTRGILRLLALWVAHNYQEAYRKASGEPLITLGLAPLENQTFRSAMFEQLGNDSLEIPLTTDIMGKNDAHAIRLDKEADDAIKKAQLHRKVATAIFFESNGGMSQAKAEATVPEIKTAVFGPDTNMVDLENVLEGLASKCYYLNWDRNRYRFGLSPNLNQILVNRRGAVQGKEIDERIRQQTQKIFDKNTTDASKHISRKYYPARTNDVPNQPVLTLVVFGIEAPAGEKKTTDSIEAIVRDCGASGRTFKSALFFAAPDAREDVREAARNLLAWEDINDDEDTKKRVDEAQLKLLERNLANAGRDLNEAIFRSYRHLYLLGRDNKLRHIDMGQITSSSAGSLVELILRELVKSDEFTEGISPTKLIKYWPPALVEWSTKGARDAFYSSPQLSRLLNPDAIKRTICDGVTGNLLGYATKDAKGNLKLAKFKQSLFDAEVEISDDMFILKAEDAQKLLEPARMAQLVVRPDHPILKVGEQVAFICTALDQYGQPLTAPAITWLATGGCITSAGLYTAGQIGGLHTIRAQAKELESIAEVRITTKEDPALPPPPPPPGKGLLRWHGTVPPQKWMNFYTKVLSRFASCPELKLEVSFEVPVVREQAQSKTDETRAGLKELGLDDGTVLS